MFKFTDQNFAEETKSGFSIIDFYADWCGPCRMMAPNFEEVARQYEGKIKMGKVNVDESPQTPSQFGVSGIPTIVFLTAGAEAGRLAGFQSKEAIIEKIKEAFGNL